MRAWIVLSEIGFRSNISEFLEPMLSLGPEVYWPSLGIVFTLSVSGYFLFRRYRGTLV